jgi:tetratricopeptide (TPR) repeat protein
LILEPSCFFVLNQDYLSRQFLLSLADIMRRLISTEGRKSLILFSEGFFIDNVAPEMIQTAAAAAQSQSIVYSLDLNRRGVTANQLGPLGPTVSAEIQSRMEPLAALSLETNGVLFNSAADWLPSALRIVADSHHYYILGFAPPAGGKDANGYRRVKVIVHRPGARVRSRTGYATRAAPKLDRRRAIDAALAAPFPQQGLSLEYTTYVIGGDGAGPAKVLVSVSTELPVRAETSTEKADIVFAVKRLKDNAVVSSGTDTISLPTLAARGRATGVGTYQVQFEAPPGYYIMRVVAREPAGSVGSADRRFQVPALPGLAVGATDLVLATPGQKLPVKARAYTWEPLTGLSELVARTPQQLTNARAKIELTQEGQNAPILTTYAELGAIVPTSAGAKRSATAVLPLDAVAPGHYVARLIVQGGSEAAETLTREVDVLAGAPPLDAATREPPIPDVVLGGVVARECLQRLAAVPELRGSAALGLAYSGRWNEADAALGTLGGAARPELHLLKGFALFALGNYARSIDELSSVLETDPKNPPVAFVLGWVYAAGGRDRDAIGSWRNATVLDPALVPAYLALADAYLRLSQPALAVQFRTAGLAARPASPELQDKLSKITAS